MNVREPPPAFRRILNLWRNHCRFRTSVEENGSFRPEIGNACTKTTVALKGRG